MVAGAIRTGAAAALILAAVAGCGSARSAGAPPATSRPAPVPTTSTVPSTTVPATTTTPAPPVAAPGWTAVRTTPTVVVTDERTYAAANGNHVTVVRFHAGTFRLALHAGSTDPATGAATLPADGRSVVGAAEVPLLVGAFNGGFKTSTGSGGVEIGGQVLNALQPGRASVVIDAAGVPRVGIYGQTVPAAGDPPVSVRQNLGLLVSGGAPSPSIGSVATWGATIGNRSVVARSALGQDALGNLLVAGSISALPADMASAVIDAGGVTAMEMDINPEWVQVDVAAEPGAPLTAAVPGQVRPAGQYLSGWSRDFFTVLAVS